MYLTSVIEMGIIIYVACGSGGMADAHGSGPCVGNNMRVQVPSSALELKALHEKSWRAFFMSFTTFLQLTPEKIQLTAQSVSIVGKMTYHPIIR